MPPPTNGPFARTRSLHPTVMCAEVEVVVLICVVVVTVEIVELHDARMPARTTAATAPLSLRGTTAMVSTSTRMDA